MNLFQLKKSFVSLQGGMERKCTDSCLVVVEHCNKTRIFNHRTQFFYVIKDLHYRSCSCLTSIVALIVTWITHPPDHARHARHAWNTLRRSSDNFIIIKICNQQQKIVKKSYVVISRLNVVSGGGVVVVVVVVLKEIEN